MANKTFRVWDSKTQTWIDELLIDNGDGTYSPAESSTFATATLGTPFQFTATITAAAISGALPCKFVVIVGDLTATDTIIYGNASAQFDPILAGQSVRIPVTDVSQVWAKSASGSQVLDVQPYI